MVPIPFAAAFWRGGTSRGLILPVSPLLALTPAARNKVINIAMGSGDPRQIDGLGGAQSSLSKCCIVSRPGEGRDAVGGWEGMGVPWTDAVKDGKGFKEGIGEWDIVWRFGQVGVRNNDIDWSATCGNMLAAVAMYSISSTPPLIPYSTLFTRSRSLPQPLPGRPLLFPLSILSAANGQIMRARVPIDPDTLMLWEPQADDGTAIKIAGVPGKALGIETELPIVSESNGMVTGRPVDTISIDGKEIKVSILSSGLPNIFVNPASLSLDADILTRPASYLTSHPTLPSLLERIRVAVATEFSIPLSLASPKIILVGSVPPNGYVTTTGERAGAADLLVRAVSSGDFHATIPGSTLAATNLGAGIAGTLIAELVGRTGDAGDELVSVRAGHAAGVADSTARFERGKCVSVVIMRTAREIMRGEIMVEERELL